MLKKGLVLVTGPTGSGKSTTLAAMIDYANKNRKDHIITVEDPIEFVHPNLKATFNQRELGGDFDTFASGLKAALRQARASEKRWKKGGTRLSDIDGVPITIKINIDQKGEASSNGVVAFKDLVAPGGRLCRQRDLAYDLLTQIPGVSVVKPKAALYMFPRLDPKVYPIEDDQQFIAELLEEERVLLVQGTGFNWPNPDHFRLVFLPHEDDLRDAINRVARFLANYRKRHGT